MLFGDVKASLNAHDYRCIFPRFLSHRARNQKNTCLTLFGQGFKAVDYISLTLFNYFERLSILVILVNCVTLGLYDPFDPECKTQRCQTLDAMEKVIYTFFLAEMLCKWIAMGLFGKLAYFAESWNRLDCFIVVAG